MEKNNDFIKDWLEGKITSEELKLRKEKNDLLVKEFDELITKSARLKVPAPVTKEQAWEKLSGKLVETSKPEAKVASMNRWIPLSIAASVGLLAIALFLLNKATVSTQVAETKVYVLPDGSEVTLNADSKIAFSRFGFTDDRVVSLEGEAFFNVKKGSSFYVETEKGAITVLGTSFNVDARASGFEVACFSGKVKVTSGGKDVLLTKGMLTTLQKSVLGDPQSFDDTQTTWRDGDFYFEGQPLIVVIDELERQFHIEIIFQGDSSRLYTGYFSNKHLDQALEMVFKPMSLSYSRDNQNKIIVQ